MRAHRRTAPRPIGPEADVHTYSITSFVSASSVGGPLCRVNSSVLLRARQIRARERRSDNYYDEISTAHVAVLRCHLSLHHNRSERSRKGAAIVRFGSKADICGAKCHVSAVYYTSNPRRSFTPRNPPSVERAKKFVPDTSCPLWVLADCSRPYPLCPPKADMRGALDMSLWAPAPHRKKAGAVSALAFVERPLISRRRLASSFLRAS
jgi:hypothetical protein